MLLIHPVLMKTNSGCVWFGYDEFMTYFTAACAVYLSLFVNPCLCYISHSRIRIKIQKRLWKITLAQSVLKHFVDVLLFRSSVMHILDITFSYHHCIYFFQQRISAKYLCSVPRFQNPSRVPKKHPSQ